MVARGAVWEEVTLENNFSTDSKGEVCRLEAQIPGALSLIVEYDQVSSSLNARDSRRAQHSDAGTVVQSENEGYITISDIQDTIYTCLPHPE